MSLHPSDGRFGQLMLPKVRGHRMVPDRAEAVIILPSAANDMMAMAKAFPTQIAVQSEAPRDCHGTSKSRRLVQVGNDMRSRKLQSA